MSRSEVYLKTQQVADALGIGVSTLKRWVDAGEIAAARTVGRHRLIALDEALRFARRNDLPTAALHRAGGAGGASPATVDDPTRDRLVEALTKGQAKEARRIIVASHAAMGSGEALADELIGPVMERIGHGWAAGTWDVFQEHQASQIVSAAIIELIGRAVRSGDSPTPIAIGASPEGDHSTLAGLLGELTLREVGWDVRNFGADLPFRSLTRGVAAYRPRLVFVSVGHVADPITFIEAYTSFHEAATAAGAAVILGGRGLRAELLARLPHEAHGVWMTDLAAFGRRLLMTVGPDREHEPLS